MSVWPTIAASGITGATAVIGYFIGDRSSRRSTAATIRQIESENDRVVQQITAENERLREQYREDHLRNRQNTYHAYMNVDRRLFAMFSYGAEPLNREQYDAIAAQLLDLYNGVLLFGAAEVREAALRLFDSHFAVFDTFMRDGSDRSFFEKMASAFHQNADALADARQECFRAMRDDVAPGL